MRSSDCWTICRDVVRPCAIASRMSAMLASTIENAEIGLLERLRDRLTSCIGCGCLSLQRCRLSNPDDRLAAEGPGPHYLLNDS